MPSTPAVLAPLFWVTLYTANNFALNELVSKYCSLLTKCHRFSFTAFVILVCSRLTLTATVSQLMCIHWIFCCVSVNLSPFGVFELLTFISFASIHTMKHLR